MKEPWMTAEWALDRAECLEADARRLREFADRLSNPGLLPDEREAEVADLQIDPSKLKGLS